VSLNRGRTWYNATACGWLIALLLAIAGGCSLLFAQTGGGDSPLSIQRIVIPAERLAKELEKVQQGALLLMPRPEFEARVERARLALQAREQKPHLTRAHYNAELIDRSLTTGSGARSQWTILHTGGAASILSIDPLNLALARLKWEQGGDAILADLDGKSLGLLVKHAGNATCLFDWSARGIPTNEGIAFNLEIPPCPLSTFDFKLPADCWLSVLKGDALVTGPHESESPSKRLWKIQVTGAKSIGISVRKITEAKGPAPLLFARIHSTQKLKPDRIDVEHEYQVDIVQGSVRELILEGDATLQPYSVTLSSGEVKDWQWLEIAAKKDAKGKPASAATGMLKIQFHQPVQGKIQALRVRSLAGRASSGLWTSAALKVRDALPRGETLEIHLHPDLPVGKWDHGSFEPTLISTESDGTQILTLAQTAADAASSRRPSLAAPLKDTDLHLTENYLWQINPRGAMLSAEIQFAPVRGNLFELRIRLPKTFPGYPIESLDMLPAEMLRSWHIDGDFLVVDLKQALTPAKKATLKIRLRGDFRELTTGIRILSYPEFEPMDGTKREGTLAVHIDPIFRAQLVSSSVPLAPVEEADHTSRVTPPTYRFTFRDQRLSAVVRLFPQPVQAQLHGNHTITLSESHSTLQFRWDALPQVGAPEFFDFRFAPGFPLTWKVREEAGSLRIHHWERLPLQEALPHLLQLGVSHGPNVAALETLLPAGAYWRFHLSEPLRKKSSFTLEATAPVGALEKEWRRISLLLPSVQPWECIAGALTADSWPKSAGDKVWFVPLMTPVQRTNVTQELDVESASEPISKITNDGSLQSPPAMLQSEKTRSHVQLHQTSDNFLEPATKITLWTRSEKRPTSQLELCDEARVASYGHKDGRIYYRIQFRLWHWHDRQFDMRFPPEMQVQAVKIHDQWLRHLDVEESNTQVRLTLPFDQNADFVPYEILASWKPHGTFLPGLRKINLPRIDWPIAPMDVRTRVFLENDLVPLNQESFCPLGVSDRIAKQSSTLRRVKQIWNWGNSWWPYSEQSDMQQKMESQRQMVLHAEAKSRDGGNKSIKLSEALERFALDFLKDQAPLVIDQIAFRSLGLSGNTAIAHSSRPFWESLGLVYVPCPSGALLTSPRRLQSLGIDGPLQSVELDEAVQEAILHGRDASSGFYLILTWLNLPPQEGNLFTSEQTIAESAPLGDSQEMSEWGIHTEGLPVDSFYVVDPLAARIFGWLLACIVSLLLWRIQRSAGPLACFRVYVLILAVSVLIVIWSPIQVREFLVLPTFLVQIGGFFWCLLRLVSRREALAPAGKSTISHPAANASIVGLLLVGITWSVSAQGPATRVFTVLIIDGARPAVLVAPDLIAKLDELENLHLHGTSGAALVSAKYTGKTKDLQTKFEVQYEIYSFKDKANLLIPLTGIQLGAGAFLDGAPVFPAAQKNGYLLPIVGKGPHNLRLSFTVRAASESNHHALHFTIPKLVQNEIIVQWLEPVQAVQCLRSCGEEKTATDPRLAVKEWHAQLGYEKNVDLTWTTAAATPPSPKAIEVKEAHFWDLRPASLTLLSSLSYTIDKGSIAQLAVALPEGLHVRGVDIPPSPGRAAPIVIKHWQISGKGDQRKLIVDLVQPVTGQVTLNLEIVPQAVTQKTKLLLTLPAPLQGESVGVLAYRLDAVEIRRTAQNLDAVFIINAADFEQQWKKQNAPSIPAGPSVSRAYSFQRKATKAWLELTTQPNARQATGNLQWNLDHHHADLEGNFTLASPLEPLIFLEFFVDKALILADVTGPDIGRWQLQESLLQVWLRQPRKETTIKMIGWRSTPLKTASANKESVFVLPCIYPLQTQLEAVTLDVRPAAGIYLKMERMVRLRTHGEGMFHYTIDATPYEATFRISQEIAPTDVSMLTKVSGTDLGMEIWHGIRLTTQRGQLPIMKLHLKDWPHEPLLVDAPGAIVQPLLDKSIKHPAWTLKYPSGLPQEVFVTLRGRVATDKHPSVALPNVELEQTTVRRHWLAWKDVEIQEAATGKKLSPEKSPKDTTISSNVWFKDMHFWNHAEARRALKAVMPKMQPRTSVRVLVSSENARLTAEHRWMHEASYWIHAPEAVELQIKFPAPVEAFNIWTDRRLHSAEKSAPQELIMPLEASPLPRLVKLRWQYSQNAERFDAPNIAAAQISQIPLPAHQRIVWIPPALLAAKSDGSLAYTLLPRLLHEAHGHMTIAALLAQDPLHSADMMRLVSERQQNFYVCIRQADFALTILKNVQSDLDSSSWLDRLNELKRKNIDLAKEFRYGKEQESAERARNASQVAESRYDFASTGVPLILTPNLPGLFLQPERVKTVSEQRMRSELFLLVAIFLLVFSYFRHGWSLLRLAAPEITMAVSAVVMGVYGISLIGILLCGMMVLIRAYRTVSAVKRWFASSPPAASQANQPSNLQTPPAPTN
jgi:hypothetical protein